MIQPVSGEGPTLSDALQNAAEQLGADSLEELSWSFVREHFRQGAWSVLVEAGLRTAEEIEALKKGREAADRAADWMRETLRLFGIDARVKSRMQGENVQVAVLTPDASLLIGREGKNIQAFQLLLRRFVERNFGEREVRLDVDSPDRDENRGRGRDRDDGDRGRGRGRGDRDRDRGRGGRGERSARDDRGERRERVPREDDAERDEAIRAEAREAAEEILAGDADAITLSDMNSYERHVAHSAIKAIEGVSSRSVGDRRDKVVEVIAD
jgi:predicted RNA-binding protein Jag